FTATGSNKGLIVYSDVALDVLEHDGLYGTIRVGAGERMRLAIEFETPETVEARIEGGMASDCDMERYFETTCAWWQQWAERIDPRRSADPQTLCSALVLKGLTCQRTGAIVAAATTSLPESLGGPRNW